MSAPFKWVSFDCYGTLIDWEEGILNALAPHLKALKAPPTPEEILSLYARFESEAERSWRPYREVLRLVARRLFAHLGLEPKEEVFLASLPRWKPFPEVNEVLPALKARDFKLALISNIDLELLEKTLAHFTFEFDALVTAEEARAYKPYDPIFDLAEARLGVAPEEVLHVAQSLFHDVVPAKRRGFRVSWVRRPGRDPFGATPRAQGSPDWVIKDLTELLELL